MRGVDDAQAHAHAIGVFGPRPHLRDSEGSSPRYTVAPEDYLSPIPGVELPPWHIGMGATWQAAFESYNNSILRNAIVPVANALSRYNFTSHDELRLYPLLEGVLRDAGFDFVREHRLDAKSRLDFWFPSLRLALEVKVRGQHSAVMRQVRRYAEHPTVGAVLLASTVAKLASVPEILESKPARAVRLAGAFG